MKNATNPAAKTQTLVMSATGTILLTAKEAKNLSIVASWGNVNAPTGTITFQAGNNKARLVAWTRVAVPSSPAGAAGSWQIEITDYGFDFFQLTYTRASGGAGDTLTLDISAKG